MTREIIATYLHELSTSECDLVFCEKMDGKSNLWNYSKHSHTYLEIIFFLSGDLNIDASDAHLRPKTYSILFYPPHVIHQEIANPHLNQEVIAIGLQVEAKATPTEAFLTSDSEGIFEFLFKQIYEHYYHRQSYSTLLIHLYIQALFYNASQRFLDSGQAPLDVAQIISEYIRTNYRQQLNLDTLAKLVSVSPSYLIRTFHNDLNTTPMQYLSDVRITMAKALFQSSCASVSEIAERVGYTDTSYFWRVFKKKTGCAPSEYRKSIALPT